MKPGPTILIIGATGKFGMPLIAELAKRAMTVRALVRNVEQETKVYAAGAQEVAIGNLNDFASIDAALNGVDGVFYVPPPFFPDEAEVGKRVVAAAEQNAVKRITFLSAIHPNLSVADNHAAKLPVEEAIINSSLQYTILQPAMTFQNLLNRWRGVLKTGVFTEPWSVDTRFSRIDARDVAEVAAISLTEDRLLYGTFELCGDTTLSRRELAALMSAVLGRDILPERTDPKSLGSKFAAFIPLFEHYDHHGLIGNALVARAILGREPRLLKRFLEELAIGQHFD